MSFILPEDLSSSPFSKGVTIFMVGNDAIAKSLFYIGANFFQVYLLFYKVFFISCSINCGKHELIK